MVVVVVPPVVFLRTILGPAGQNLQAPSNFFVTTNNGVEFAVGSHLGQIGRVLLQKISGLGLRSAHGLVHPGGQTTDVAATGWLGRKGTNRGEILTMRLLWYHSLGGRDIGGGGRPRRPAGKRSHHRWHRTTVGGGVYHGTTQHGGGVCRRELYGRENG